MPPTSPNRTRTSGDKELLLVSTHLDTFNYKLQTCCIHFVQDIGKLSNESDRWILWSNGQHIRLRSGRSPVQISPGTKIFSEKGRFGSTSQVD